MSKATSMIARRYFFSRRKIRYLPFLTTIAICGVALGTCAMVVILSVMDGFAKEVEKRLLGFSAHVTITQENDFSNEQLTPEKISEIIGAKKILDAVPFAEGEVIVEARVGEELFAQGARIRGVDPKDMGSMVGMKYYLSGFSDIRDALSQKDPDKKLAGIILGKEILSQLNVHPDFEDVVETIAPLADVGPTGDIEPRLKRYKLVGYFDAGVYEYDTHYALINIHEAKSLLGAQVSEGWQLRLQKPGEVKDVVAGLKQTLGDDYKIEGWHERNKKLFAALKLERLAMGGVLTLVILIASFSVIGVIMMVVSSKRKDIALLKALGMKSDMVKEVFLRQGMWIGIIGSSVGSLLGILICIGISLWPIDLPQSYYVEVLKVSIRPLWIITIAVLGVALAVMASVYPVIRAVKEEPILALRYE